jgi:hypothetical protein
MEGSRDTGIDRLLARVKPRWDEKRHERVFAAIVARIRQEEGHGEGRGARPGAHGSPLRLSHAAR